MVLPKEGSLLRIFIGESDKHEGMPLYEWIVTESKGTGTGWSNSSTRARRVWRS